MTLKKSNHIEKNRMGIGQNPILLMIGSKVFNALVRKNAYFLFMNISIGILGMIS